MQIIAIFVAYPLAALLVAAAFVALYAARRVTAAALAAAAWAIYAGYEYLMHIRVLCSGECNIRVDLLLIYPLLLWVSVWAIVRATRVRPG